MKTRRADPMRELMEQLVRVLMMRPGHFMNRNGTTIELCGALHKSVLAYAALLSAEGRFFSRAQLSAITGVSPTVSMASLLDWEKQGVCVVNYVPIPRMQGKGCKYVYQIRLKDDRLSEMPKARGGTPKAALYCERTHMPMLPEVRKARDEIMREGAFDMGTLAEKSTAGVSERRRLVQFIRRMYPNANVGTLWCAFGLSKAMLTHAMYVRRVGSEVVNAGGAA